MVYEMITSNVYKVLVSEQELKQYGLTYNSLDYSDEKTKEFLSMMIDEVVEYSNIDVNKTDIAVNKGKVYIESFPDVSGGCIFFVSLSYLHLQLRQQIEPSKQEKLPSGKQRDISQISSKKENQIERYCYVFDSINHLSKAVKVTSFLLKNLVEESILYKVQGYYVLVISYYSKQEKIPYVDTILKEYVSKDTKQENKLDHAYLHFLQQGERIIHKDAVENILSYL